MATGRREEGGNIAVMVDGDIGKLKNEVKSKRAIFIIGAGVSLASTRDDRMGWYGLMKCGLEELREHFPDFSEELFNLYSQLLELDDITTLINVAQKIEESLDGPSGGAFKEWLRNVFENVNISNPHILEALKRLMEYGCLVATTNYDGLLERISGYKPITWRDQNDVDRFFRGQENSVLHLHGYWEEPESVVLGWNSYEKIKPDEAAQAFLKTIRIRNTPIFVGCGRGLGDPNIGRFLEWAGKCFRKSESCMYLLEKHDRVETTQRLHPATERFVVVDYGNEYEDLAPFLKQLLPVDADSPDETIILEIKVAVEGVGLLDVNAFDGKRTVGPISADECAVGKCSLSVVARNGDGKEVTTHLSQVHWSCEYSGNKQVYGSSKAWKDKTAKTPSEESEQRGKCRFTRTTAGTWRVWANALGNGGIKLGQSEIEITITPGRTVSLNPKLSPDSEGEIRNGKLIIPKGGKAIFEEVFDQDEYGNVELIPHDKVRVKVIEEAIEQPSRGSRGIKSFLRKYLRG